MSRASTLFVVKEDEEYCILFDEYDPISLYEVLFDYAERPDLGISREEAFEVIEDLVPGRLRSL